MSLLVTVRTWGRMVKFSHSVFALPFAATGTVLAAASHGISGRQILWILVAMVGARNAAMGFNRLVDHSVDARNPRTAGRELPRGTLSRRAVWAFTVALAGLFVYAASRLGPVCLALSPLALAVVFGYSFTKRFTWASHLVLGTALAIAPVGGWVAVAGTLEGAPWLLALAVLLWVAGFDVVYACQDAAFDRAESLHSIPARFGVPGALALARLFHVLAVVALAGVGLLLGLHWIYWPGLAVIASVLAWEHRLVRADDLSKIGVAFFNANGLVSLVYLVVVTAAVALGPRGL